MFGKESSDLADLNYSSSLARNFSVNVKLQNCYGNVSYISVPRWRQRLKMLLMKEVTVLKYVTENLNYSNFCKADRTAPEKLNRTAT